MFMESREDKLKELLEKFFEEDTDIDLRKLARYLDRTIDLLRKEDYFFRKERNGTNK